MFVIKELKNSKNECKFRTKSKFLHTQQACRQSFLSDRLKFEIVSKFSFVESKKIT